MRRRTFVRSMTALVATAPLAGCPVGGEVLLREQDITATTPTKEWEVDLEEGQQLTLAVTIKDGTTVTGYVHRADTGEEVAAASATRDTTREEFEVPATGTYVVSIEVNGSTGSITLQEA